MVLQVHQPELLRRVQVEGGEVARVDLEHLLVHGCEVVGLACLLLQSWQILLEVGYGLGSTVRSGLLGVVEELGEVVDAGFLDFGEFHDIGGNVADDGVSRLDLQDFSEEFEQLSVIHNFLIV